jgi:metal-sulfur cluster biosynthetic enzyme
MPAPPLPLILDALRDVIDPELGYNIVDMGLIYGIGVEEDLLWLRMTMTTPGCPAQDYIQDGVRQRGLRIDGIREVEIELVWEPPWSVHHMSPQAKTHFGVKDAGYG